MAISIGLRAGKLDGHSKTSRFNRSGHPEAERDVACLSGLAHAVGGAKLQRSARQRAASNDAPGLVAAIDPWRAIVGCSLIGFVHTVLDPLPHIAVHVVETEGIGFERADGRFLSAVPRPAAALAIGVAGTDFLAPRVGVVAAGARGIFPLGFGEQPIRFACLAGSHFANATASCHVKSRRGPPATDVAARLLGASASGLAFAEFGTHDFGFGDRKGFCNGDFVAWPFTGIAVAGS